MSTNKKEQTNWDLVLRPKKSLLDINFTDIWRYRDLIVLFVKRDFVIFYKQTILGPIWYFIQPLFTTLVFSTIFGSVAKIPTDGIPPFLFYLSGIISWNYFALSLNSTSSTFISNAGIFGKVYFPRMIVPISTVIINMVHFLIQFILFLGVYVYFLWNGADLKLSIWIFGLPIAILQMACLGMGIGILISSLTTKYRDLAFLMTFGIQLWMYASPVVYPASIVPEAYKFLYMLNPMAVIIETFRYAFLGKGTLDPIQFLISWSITLGLLFIGIIIFHKTERNFMDTV
jgi:lipopolysaccharide transport system permease protein